MLVTIYGARGSFPTPQPSMMRYGGNTTCVAVQLSDGTHLVLDAGTGMRNYGKDLLRAGLPPRVHFLLSHLHHDHVFGMPFFEPVYRPDFELVVHRVTPADEDPFNPIPEIFDGIQTPVPVHELPCTVTLAEDGANIGSATVSRLALNHPGSCTGFRIDDADGASFTFFTDNELHPPGTPTSSRQEQTRFAANTGLLFQDAQYLDAEMPTHLGWGHSSVREALERAAIIQPLCLLLTHHDPDRSDAALDAVGQRAATFAQEHLPGDALVAYEGMRFEVTAARCERLVDRWHRRPTD